MRREKPLMTATEAIRSFVSSVAIYDSGSWSRMPPAAMRTCLTK